MRRHTLAAWTAAVIGTAGLLVVTWSTHDVRAAGPFYAAPGGNDAGSCSTPLAPCATLAGALAKAASGDTIFAASGTYTSTNNPVLSISKSVSLSGGWDSAFARQEGFSVVDGEHARYGLSISGGATVTLDRFIVERGNFGGLTVFDSVLVVNRSTIRNNTSEVSGGGILAGNSTVTLNNTSLHDNIAAFSAGGAIHHFSGSLTLNNVTISSNRAGTDGGGIAVGSSALSINSSTIANNTAVVGSGGGLSVLFGTLTLRNTILAGNSALAYASGEDSPECTIEAAAVTSLGHNLIGDTTGCAIGLAAGDLSQVDARLGPLEGEPAFAPLLPGSPAVNAGSPAGCQDGLGAVLGADQRGMPRVGQCDIGAFELGLALSQSLQGWLRAGQTVTYTLSLQNAEGAEILSNAALTDTLPAQLAYVPGTLSASQGAALESNNVITWTGDVPGSQPVTITFAAEISPTLPSGVVVTNSVSASWETFRLAADSAFDGLSRSHLPLAQSSHTPCADVLVDDFSSPHTGWPAADDAYFSAGYVAGEYSILPKQGGYLFLVQAPTCQSENYVVEADMRWEGTPGSSYGLIFRVSDDFSAYYLFDINTDLQAYRVYKREPGGFTEVVPVTSNSAILAGGASNHLKVIRNADWFSLAINGVYLNLWSDTIIGPDEAFVGLVASAYLSGPAAEARFDNFSFTALPDTSSLNFPVSPAQPDRARQTARQASLLEDSLGPWVQAP